MLKILSLPSSLSTFQDMLFMWFIFCVAFWIAALPFPGEEDQEQVQRRHPQEALHEQDQPPAALHAPPLQLHEGKGMHTHTLP